jgi:hypothetical protein
MFMLQLFEWKSIWFITVTDKVTVPIPELYDYTQIQIPFHLFLHMSRTIPEGAVNASA